MVEPMQLHFLLPPFFQDRHYFHELFFRERRFFSNTEQTDRE
jgi:hypothetical protein